MARASPPVTLSFVCLSKAHNCQLSGQMKKKRKTNTMTEHMTTTALSRPVDTTHLNEYAYKWPMAHLKLIMKDQLKT